MSCDISGVIIVPVGVSLTLGDLPLEINTRGRNGADEIQNKTERNTRQNKTSWSCQT